ncbi:MAG: hypoxanthine phosphoribosyltransferase [Armatimonadota bacterium]|nr:hypoxanthine phosphoribosyltransferase [Armatimonadota bacterium]
MTTTHSPREDIAEVIATEAEIRDAVERLAGELTEDVGELSPILVGVLNGAFVFLADLVRRLDFPLEIDFMNASSYGEGTVSEGLEIQTDLSLDVEGRHVVLVDDILDTGQTLQGLVRHVTGRGAASVRTCCLLDKPARRTVDFEADYVGIEIPDRFVVGYGLDFAQRHRNLPFIGVLRPELYQSQ